MSTPTRIISEQTKRLIQGRATIEVPVKSSSESVTPLVQANYELGDLLGQSSPCTMHWRAANVEVDLEL